MNTLRAIVRWTRLAGLLLLAVVVWTGNAFAANEPQAAPFSSFAIQNDELVDVPDFSVAPAQFLEDVPSDPAASGAEGESRFPSDGVVRRTIDTLDEFLPEGMIPVVTGPTTEKHRASGVGEPLVGTSWLTNSHSAGMFLGAIGGSSLIDNHLEESIGGFFGLRFGIDYDHRWGLEKRFGFAQMNAYDIIQHQRQVVSLEMGDVDWMFYPWGDTRWRPYMAMGVGLAHFNYESQSGRHIDRLLVGLPFGMGLKYFWNEGVTLRVEIVDNLMLGTHELSTMNNLSLVGGIEFRYSGFHFGFES